MVARGRVSRSALMSGVVCDDDLSLIVRLIQVDFIDLLKTHAAAGNEVPLHLRSERGCDAHTDNDLNTNTFVITIRETGT